MERLSSCLVIIALTISVMRADEAQSQQNQPTKAEEELLSLNKEFEAAKRKFFDERDELAKKLQLSKDDTERSILEKKLEAWGKRLLTEGPMTKFGPRFLAFAEKNAQDSAGITTLELVLRDEFQIGDVSNIGAGPNWQKAVAVLQKQYVGIPGVRKLLPLLAFSGDEASEKFVRAVMEKNPDRLTQARAVQALASACERFAALANELKNDKELRKETELERGKEFVEKAIAQGEKAQEDLKELATRIREKYTDIIPCVGKEAPDVICQDIDGKKVKLSDLKGKVVVLDIWATWCVPCVAMIPHQREIVGKLKDKPFTLVSISVDTDRDTVRKFLEKEPMPWTHWWNGKVGGIVEDWNVSHFPTIYVLDAHGVIRHRDQNGEFPRDKLEGAVNALLREIEMKK